MNARFMLFGALPLCVLLACNKAPEPKAAAPEPVAEALSQTSGAGPVQATVTLSPKKPRLGDPLTLTLTVSAQPGFSVEMPPFGEALGRFSITSFTPRIEHSPDGSTRHSQRYVLEIPMSGRQRIPALRIEFTDRRTAAGTGSGADAGAVADGGADAVHELLTDELSIDVESVLPTDADKLELRGLRGPLDENVARTRALYLLLVPLGLVLLASAFFLIRRMQRRAQLQVRISAYDVAVQRLDRLKRRGWPQKDEADAWYVELSDIVRRYIEDRYGVRAPELTTEEFLREARQQLSGLGQAQRELLEAFLLTCDRVKFAGYRPGESESQQALAEAGRFLEDTRIVAQTSAGRPAGAEAQQ